MSKNQLKWISLSLIAAIVVLFGLSKMGVFGDRDNSKEVEIAKADEITIIETVSATGKIQPEIEVKVSSQVSGEIIQLPVKEGQVVKKGDLLVKINPDIYTSGLNRTVSNYAGTKAGLTQADASFKEAQANFERNKTLYEKGIISKADWDKAIANFEVAKANKQSAYYNVQSANASVVEAKDNLGRTIIYAPADGTISVLNVELGEKILGTQQMAGTELLRVANLNLGIASDTVRGNRAHGKYSSIANRRLWSGWLDRAVPSPVQSQFAMDEYLPCALFPLTVS